MKNIFGLPLFLDVNVSETVDLVRSELIDILLIGILCAILLAPLLLVLAAVVISFVRKSVHNGIFTAISLAVIILCWFAYITNFGWLHVFILITTLPVTYACLLFVVTFFSSCFMKHSPTVTVSMIVGYVTAFLSYAFIPGVPDVGPGYVFFGLIQGGFVWELGVAVLTVAIPVNIAAMVLQIIFSIRAIIRINKSKKAEKLKALEGDGILN